MPFSKSVVLHFPAEVHKTQGVTEVVPQLLGDLDAHRIAAVQFLRNGRVRVTAKTSEYRDELLEGSTFLYGDVPIPVTAADQHIRPVFVRDLPVELSDDDVKCAFESFGVVRSVHQCFFRVFPSIANGTRRLFISFVQCHSCYCPVDSCCCFICIATHRRLTRVLLFCCS